jgi:hypothetical protein
MLATIKPRLTSAGSRQRIAVRVRAAPERENLPVFQAHPNISCITLWDVEDVLAVASHFTNEKDATDYCHAQGVHRENAVMYYPVVTKLKACYKMPAYERAHT